MNSKLIPCIVLAATFHLLGNSDLPEKEIIQVPDKEFSEFTEEELDGYLLEIFADKDKPISNAHADTLSKALESHDYMQAHDYIDHCASADRCKYYIDLVHEKINLINSKSVSSFLECIPVAIVSGFSAYKLFSYIKTVQSAASLPVVTVSRPSARLFNRLAFGIASNQNNYILGPGFAMEPWRFTAMLYTQILVALVASGYFTANAIFQINDALVSYLTHRDEAQMLEFFKELLTRKLKTLETAQALNNTALASKQE